MSNVGRCRGGGTAATAAAATLRQLLAQRFPAAHRSPDSVLPTGIRAIDDRTGGLPKAGLTELVCSARSGGSQLFLGQLLQVTREQNVRIALVDRHDAFDPDSWPPALLEHVLWVRAHHATEALHATDLLLRDANLGLVVLDLRHTAIAELRRIPSPTWYRLQRAIEPTPLAGVIVTPFALVPSARLRLELNTAHLLAHHARPRPELSLALAPALLRQRLSPSLTA